MATRTGPWNRSFGLYLSDLRRSNTDSHGIINYAVGLASAISRKLANAERLVIYANTEIATELDIPGDSPNCEMHVQDTPTTVPSRLWSDHIRSAVAASRSRLDLLHFPKGYVPLVSPGVRVLATLHDDIPVQYASGRWGEPHGWEAKLKARYFSWAVRNAVKRADMLIAVSTFTRDAIGSLARLQLPPTVVTYEGVTLPFRPHVPVAERQPYLLHLGSRHPHKRSHDAIEFGLRFITEHDHVDRLLVTGTLDQATEARAVDPRVTRVTDVLGNAELARLMGEARSLIFTSEYEGFGLPPVEAYCQGTPAVYTGAASMPEVMGDAPGSFLVGDYESFESGLLRVLRMGDVDLVKLQKRFRERYSWPVIAARTLDAYRATCAGSPHRGD